MRMLRTFRHWISDRREPAKVLPIPGFDRRRAEQMLSRIKTAAVAGSLLTLALGFAYPTGVGARGALSVHAAVATGLTAIAWRASRASVSIERARRYLAAFGAVVLGGALLLVLGWPDSPVAWLYGAVVFPLTMVAATGVMAFNRLEGLIAQGAAYAWMGVAFVMTREMSLWGIRVDELPAGAVPALAFTLALLGGIALWGQGAAARALRDHYDDTYRDPLTRLPNRGFLETWMERVGRERGAFSLALIDVDNFKDINDTWGHPVGDDVLKAIARAMEGNIRRDDVVGRYGGEEFLFIGVGADTIDVRRMAERLRSAVEVEASQSLGIAVTVSVGATLCMAHETFLDAINRADSALYRAKGQGKNKVCMSRGAGAPGSARASM